MYKYLTWILALGWISITTAQNQEIEPLIFLKEMNERMVVPHAVAPGNTIYNLSKKYQITQDALLAMLVEKNKTSLQLGDTLLIPIQSSQISMIPSHETDIRLYYQVKPKENLFRIARIYLGLKEEQIMVLNQMTDINLAIGQQLFIGYLNRIPSDPLVNQPTPTNAPVVINEEKLEEISEAEKAKEINTLEELKVPKIFRESSGVALWFDDTDVNSGRFIMHESAPVNSIIAITNPMFNKTVYARVVGNIPPKTYPKEIIAVISPSVAKELGALDKRFFAKIKYELPNNIGG